MHSLLNLYNATFGFAPVQTETLAKAGSNRHYVRLTAPDQTTVIGVVSPDIDESRCFVKLARHFAERHLPVPHIISVAEDYGCYLQEDLGRQALYDVLSAGRQAGSQYSGEEIQLLKRTIRLLPHMQVEGAEGLDWDVLLPPRRFTPRAAMFDLNYFKYMFLRTSDLPFDEEQLEDDLLQLAADLAAMCQEHTTFLYRDFQARNVMVRPDGELALIDFQGGQCGPIYYDVASFLSQASARYPQSLRQELAEEYLSELRKVAPWAPSHEEFVSNLRLFYLFRTLQVLGAYGLRGRFERKPYFLNSIPPALDNLRQILAEGTVRPYPYLEKILCTLTSL